MLNRFTKEARLVVGDSIQVARDLGAPTVEAEHLLLAVAAGDAPAATVMRDAGLDFDGLAAALVAETTRSLAAVGVSADAVHFSPFVESPRLATSAKLALERSLQGRGGAQRQAHRQRSTSRSARCGPRPAPSPARSSARASTVSS